MCTFVSTYSSCNLTLNLTTDIQVEYSIAACILYRIITCGHLPRTAYRNGRSGKLSHSNDVIGACI